MATGTKEQQLMTPTPSLLDRMGGLTFLSLVVANFFDEIAEDKELVPFFRHVPLNAMKTHQIKFFTLVLGDEPDQPDSNDLVNYLLMSHTRLFRDLGLNEVHFDLVANCLLKSLQSFQVDPPLIAEVVARMDPLRVVFEYGAKVAADEQTMSSTELETLPKVSADSVMSTQRQVLPGLPVALDTPDWLGVALSRTVTKRTPSSGRKKSKTQESKEWTARAWTCDLTERFEADPVVADAFMAIPLALQHVYLLALLRLAFCSQVEEKCLWMVLYPRGTDHPAIVRSVFERMIRHFAATCEAKELSPEAKKAALQQLESMSVRFQDILPTKVGAKSHLPHSLHPNRRHERFNLEPRTTKGDGPVQHRRKSQKPTKNQRIWWKPKTWLNVARRQTSFTLAR